MIRQDDVTTPQAGTTIRNVQFDSEARRNDNLNHLQNDRNSEQIQYESNDEREEEEDDEEEEFEEDEEAMHEARRLSKQSKNGASPMAGHFDFGEMMEGGIKNTDGSFHLKINKINK